MKVGAWRLLAGAALAIASLAPAAAAPVLPNRALTPGDVLTTSAKVVCLRGYSGRVRNVPQSVKNLAYARYGLAGHAPGAYEVDHLISLELGGSNSILNLWPQAYGTSPWNARVKDGLENKLHALVCAGRLSLPTAQRAIAADWTAAYRQFVGSTPVARPATPAAKGPAPKAPPTRRAHCRDFSTRAQATAFMKAHGAAYLDANHNGVACDSLP